jgi:hypothetical protein
MYCENRRISKPIFTQTHTHVKIQILTSYQGSTLKLQTLFISILYPSGTGTGELVGASRDWD